MVHLLIVVLLLIILLFVHLEHVAQRKIAAHLGLKDSDFCHWALLKDAMSRAGCRDGLAPNPRADTSVNVSKLLTHPEKMEMKFASDDAGQRKRRTAQVKAGFLP